MKTKIHQRALELSAKSLVSELNQDDRSWLERHVAACESCAEEIAVRNELLAQMRSIPISARECLVHSTQRRIRECCVQMRLRQTRMRPIWISCGLASFWALFSTPYLWEEFDAIGHMMRVPDMLWQMAFLVAWFTPAMTAAAVVFWLRPKLTSALQMRESIAA